jgi:hypothetical protein
MVVLVVGFERATSAPRLRVVDAPAASIQRADGGLGPARPLWVADFALSPDGDRLAVGSEKHNRIELFDLRAWPTSTGPM